LIGISAAQSSILIVPDDYAPLAIATERSLLATTKKAGYAASLISASTPIDIAGCLYFAAKTRTFLQFD